MNNTYFQIGAVVLLTFSCSFAFAQENAKETSENIQTRITRLISLLGDSNCMIRDDAQEQLIRLGTEAQPYLLEAINNGADLEIYHRASFILQAMPQNWDLASDPPELRTFLTHYVSYDSLSKMLLWNEMNRLPIPLRVQALDRIFKKEKDVNNAFIAAILFWYYRPENNPEFITLVQNMLKPYEKANYLPAQNLFYLINYVSLRKEATFWFDNQFENLTLLDRVPPNPNGTLQRYIATILAELARREAENALTPEQITEGKKKVFKPIDWNNPTASNNDDAVPTATNARARLGSPRRYIIAFLAAAYSPSDSESDSSMSLYSSVPLIGPLCLLKRNMIKEAEDWIFWEASCTLLNNVSSEDGDRLVYQILAETLNDYSYHQLAAEVFSKAKPKSLAPENKARICYYKALQAQKEGNRKLQWECVQNALKEDKTELDSLIMQWEMCQIPPDKLGFNDITDEIREKQEQNIINMLDSLEISINKSNLYYLAETNLCNQYAWLAVKTRHNLDKALKFAIMAVESNAQSAACLDTLAHVYAAQGNYNKAIEIQKQAVDKDPVSYSIYNNLLIFIEQKRQQE